MEDGDEGLGAGPAGISLRAAAAQLRGSLDAVEHRIRTGERGRYIRSAALVTLTVDHLPPHSPLRHALRDFTSLDGALARLASALQMEVADYDTARRQCPTARRLPDSQSSLNAGHRVKISARRLHPPNLVGRDEA